MLLQNTLQDLRYAVRQLRQSPGFTATAVLTLALGIAANTTIFSWIDATLLTPIPGVTHTGDMITLQRGDRSEHPSPPFSYSDYVDLRANAHTLSGFLAYHDDYISLTGSGKPERIYGALTSANYFEVLGVKPVLGRTLLSTSANERAGAAEIVLGYDLWKNHFAGDPSIVGKTVQINLHPYTVVGVAPRGFQGCKSGLRTEAWIPLGMDRQVWGSDRIDYRGASWLNVLARLAPGVDARQAAVELNTIMQRIVADYPEPHQGANTISTDPLWRSPFGANVYMAGTLPILLALAAVLLLLACANVANLLLVRSVGRRRELAIRLSLGASRWRVARQLLLENLLIAFAGAGVALALTVWTTRALGGFVPSTELPLSLGSHVNGSVLIAAILVAIFTAAVSGIVPALRASSLSPVEVLKDESLSTSGGASRSRLSGGLVVVQVSLSLLLLTCAGLFVRSLQNMQRSDPGFDPEHMLVATFDLGPLGYNSSSGIEFQRQVIDRVSQLQGVQSATLADFSPLSFTIHSEGVMPEGYVPRPHESVEVDRGIVGPHYLQTLRTPLIAGRDFTAQDNAAAAPVAVINQALVDRYWPGQNAIGKRIQDGNVWTTVVGVAANGKYRRLTYDASPLILVPLMQRYENEVILQARVAGNPMEIAPEVERTIHGINADLPIFNVSSMKDSMRMGNIFERIAVTFAGSFGLLALVLAAVGIYGVVAYTTRQRTHEIGIRMALGAGKASIFRQVLAQGLRLTLAGLAAGIVVSLFLTRFLRNMLVGVGVTDWFTYTAVAVLLCVIALAACFFPARRAASVDPMKALRTE
jgi:predicted permease